MLGCDVEGLLRLVEEAGEVPKTRDPRVLPGGAKAGRFWDSCISGRRCDREPYRLEET